MNMLAGDFGQFVNGIFANWQMILFVLLAVLLLVVIVFRKVRIIKFIGIIAVPVITLALIASLVVLAISWTWQEALDFGVKWGPTILFAVIVVFHTWLNSWRGLRKSLIFLLHSAVIGAVCIAVYALLIKLPEVDAFMLTLADTFIAGGGSFAEMLGVTAPCSGLKDVFVCWLPTVVSGDFSVMLGGTAAYIYTLADLIYHVAFALFLLVIYYVLNFIMYIIYHCCYSERKYKRKIEWKYHENKVDRRYSRHIVGGGVVGVVRGIAVGLLTFSFFGSALYIVAGRGDGKLKDYDFGDSNVNTYYSVYRSIESYGTYGIFSVLNAISSTEEVPYYLFAADLVFSGELNDEELGVSGNIVFREELDAYRAFAVDTMELLLKYGEDRIKPLINGTATNDAFDTVISIMNSDGFRHDFTDLIGEFDAQTYILNFALSFVNSAIANIDSMSFAGSLSEDNRELLKILFTKGYMSDAIPDERIVNQMASGSSVIFERPYINISKLITKQDAQLVFNIVMDVMAGNASTMDNTLNLIGKIIPEVQKLSMLSADRTKEFDPVLGRLYCYAANRYLSEEGSAGVTYAEIYEEKIEWVNEINSLISVANSALQLYKNISSVGQPQDMLLAIFDSNDVNYAENSKYYDDVCDSIIKSRLLGKALSTSFVYNNIVNVLQGVFKDAYVPKDTVYVSTYDNYGNLVSAGETYLVLNAVRILGRQTELLSMLKTFDSSTGIGDLVRIIADALEIKDENGKVLSSYFVDSNLLRSVISSMLINSAEEYVYVPTFARETNDDGKSVNYITKSELTALLNSFGELSDIILPVIDGDDVKDVIVDFINRDSFRTLLDESTIFEGTVGKLLANNLGSDNTVIIPTALTTKLDGWASERGRQGELKNLLNALDVSGIQLEEILDGQFDSDKITDTILSFDTEQLDICLKSSVLHYTLSNQLIQGIDFGSFSLIVPVAAQQELKDDVISGVVKKTEIQNILSVVKDFDLSDDTDVSRVLVKLVENKSALSESYILSASVVYTIVNDETVNDILTVPQVLEEAATKERLRNFNSANPWKTEIIRLVDALDEIMGISVSEKFTFDEDALSDSLSQFLKDTESPSHVNERVSRLTLCYASQVIASSITVELDDMLVGKVESTLLSGAKSSNGNYTEKELQSLSGALKIFDIDVMDVDGDELTQKVKEQVLTLNESAEGYEGKSKLQVIYPSVIISGMLSSELDNALLDKDNDGADAKIDAEVLSAIKSGKSYTETEISNLINAVKEFGIESFDDIDELDINDIKGKQDRIEEICKSQLIKGVLTKQIRDKTEFESDHPRAYEEDLKVFKTQEIVSIVSLIDKVGDGNENLEDMYFDEVKFVDFRDAIFNADGSVKSYLVLGAVSDIILDNSYLYVNVDLVDVYKCISPKEVLSLIDAFIIMEGEDVSLDYWSNNANSFNYPTPEQREGVFSSEIVRAKFTNQIKNANIGGANYFKASNYTQFTDSRTRDKEWVISYGQMIALFGAIDVLNGDSKFNMPDVDLNYIMSVCQRYDEEQTRRAYVKAIYDCDAARYKLCEDILSLSYLGELETINEEAIDMIHLTDATKKVLDFETVVWAITYKSN